MVKLAQNRYGKSRVRLLKVTRHEEHHHVDEWTVEVLLQGDFVSAHVEGDNSKILPTDTMKNTVYYVAHRSNATSMEHFAEELIDFLLSRNPQVLAAEVTVHSALWKHMKVDGSLHPTAFIRGSDEQQTTHVVRHQPGGFHVTSGLSNLVIMKTANSGFEDYIVDELTTLKPTSDRIFATACTATWKYIHATPLHYNQLRERARETMLHTFAAHESKSVQQTLYAMGEAVLEAVPEISEITLTMPNKHALLVDLDRFGVKNNNEIFVPTDEPHGTIQATLVRM
ncbi:factor-independent urate hydroxylase [Terriglobus sp. 2YAB30_2]|uniref:factor-independent urate hydroxylase n=1 Tax=unclassified Terriglobus TaxID=2628988 RepID=UPI003F94638B